MKLLLILLVLGTAFATQEYIDGEYLIVLNEHVDEEALVSKLKMDYSVDVKKAYRFTKITIMLIKGDDADVERAAKLAEIKSMDRNKIYHIDQCSSGSAAGCWGLDRSDQAGQLGYTSPIDPSAVYNWGQNDGAGVRVYVIDTGIDTTHSDFGGRAVWGMAAGDYPESDQNGHGTHCAGTIGSNSYGVAKSSTPVAVRVMSALGSGSTGDIVEGLNWVEADHAAGDDGVGNMSLGGSGSNGPMNAAVQACIDDGVAMSISAGNSDADACNFSPAMVPDAITVCATDVEDVSASFTNFGTCVDICAPGVDILSTQPGEDTAVFSGTSMSAPHVAGGVARYLSSNPGASPAQVRAWLVGDATQTRSTSGQAMGLHPTC